MAKKVKPENWNSPALALSGGGFRATLYHCGADAAERAWLSHQNHPLLQRLRRLHHQRHARRRLAPAES